MPREGSFVGRHGDGRAHQHAHAPPEALQVDHLCTDTLLQAATLCVEPSGSAQIHERGQARPCECEHGPTGGDCGPRGQTCSIRVLQARYPAWSPSRCRPSIVAFAMSYKDQHAATCNYVAIRAFHATYVVPQPMFSVVLVAGHLYLVLPQYQGF